MWQRWSYSEVVEFSLQKIADLKEDYDEIGDADVEYTEQLQTLLTMKILERI